MSAEVLQENIGLVDSIEKLDVLMNNVEAAQQKFQTYSQDTVDQIFKRCALAANQHRLELAKLAVDEAGMGNVEDKTIKNHFSAETVYNAYCKMKTCGIVEEEVTEGYALYAEPVGILAGIVPCTNPTSTTIFKILIALKTRNCIVISPHPRTVRCTVQTAKILYRAAVEAGAPSHCVGWIDKASIGLCTELMRHPKVSMIVATGAGGLIKAAYSSGKPCMGGSSGNTPVIIDETANIPMSVNSILLSKTFDNGMICASEQAVIAVESVAQKVKDEFVKRGCYFLKNEMEKEKLANVIFKADGSLKPEAVGQPASKLLTLAGIDPPFEARVILAELETVGSQEMLSREKLCTCLGFFKAEDYDRALEIALSLVRFGGLGHTSVLYTNLQGPNRHDRVRKFEDMMPTGRTLFCMPTSQGAIGGLFNGRQNPSMSLGCGSWGGNSSAEGLQPKHLLNYKQIVERRGSQMQLKTPDVMHIGCAIWENAFRGFVAKNAVNLCHITIIHPNLNDPLEESLITYITGILQRIQEICSENKIKVSTKQSYLLSSTEILRISNILDLANEVAKHDSDALLALGDTSIIDATKLVRLIIEEPSIDWDTLGIRFMNMTQRIVTFPIKGRKIKQLICMPVACSSGAEVSPYAIVVNDTSKVSLPTSKVLAVLDSSLVPDVVIADTKSAMYSSEQSFKELCCTALSNALEALVSTLATKQVKKHATEAIEIFVKCLSSTFENNIPEYQTDCFRAAVSAGIASANAFLGIGEAITHQLMCNFKLSHGQAKLAVLCQVINFNAAEAPTKLATNPHYDRPKAKEEYAELIRNIPSLRAAPNCSDDECVKILIEFIQNTKQKLGIPLRMCDMKVEEEDFLSKVYNLALEAFDNQFVVSNPRYPLISELVQLLMDAYYGKVDKMYELR